VPIKSLSQTTTRAARDFKNDFTIESLLNARKIPMPFTSYPTLATETRLASARTGPPVVEMRESSHEVVRQNENFDCAFARRTNDAIFAFRVLLARSPLPSVVFFFSRHIALPFVLCQRIF
jgi:hypothetical protein